ncbi:MAG: hypothetical protein RL685_4451 [Pseudomonadota bacterium]
MSERQDELDEEREDEPREPPYNPAEPPPPDDLAAALIGDDPEPEGGWHWYNEKGQRVDANGNVLPPEPAP